MNGVPTFPVCPVRAAFFSSYPLLLFARCCGFVVFFFSSAVVLQVNQFLHVKHFGERRFQTRSTKTGISHGFSVIDCVTLTA